MLRGPRVPGVLVRGPHCVPGAEDKGEGQPWVRAGGSWGASLGPVGRAGLALAATGPPRPDPAVGAGGGGGWASPAGVGWGLGTDGGASRTT